MRLLIDTHALVWAATEPARLGARASNLFGDATHELFLSAVSCWELAIKSRLGKFPVPPEHLGAFIGDQLVALTLEELVIDQ